MKRETAKRTLVTLDVSQGCQALARRFDAPGAKKWGQAPAAIPHFFTQMSAHHVGSRAGDAGVGTGQRCFVDAKILAAELFLLRDAQARIVNARRRAPPGADNVLATRQTDQQQEQAPSHDYFPEWTPGRDIPS